MCRPFPRTSGSPQAPAIVETPAHYAPTLFCRLGSLVRGGDWKCRAYYVLCLLRNTVQIYENTSNIPKKKDKNLRFYGFLGCSNTLLVIIARGKREKGTGKQGTRRHVTGSETACLSIRTPARMN